MSAIVVFSERELALVRRMRAMLHDQGNRHELEAVANNEKALNDLAAAVSAYPSILGIQSLGGAMAYPAYTPEDPREFYRSFRYRRRSALVRAGSARRGPKMTLEEYLMCYLLSRAEWLTP